jgi:putative resolvase
VARVEAEVGSGVRGSRTKLRRLLADPNVSTVVVERRDRLAAVNVELVEAALSAHGRRLVVVDEGEVDDVDDDDDDDDDLVEDMTELLTSFCARRYGRRSARNRAEKALRGAEHDVGPIAVAQEAKSLAVSRPTRKMGGWSGVSKGEPNPSERHRRVAQESEPR